MLPYSVARICREVLARINLPVVGGHARFYVVCTFDASGNRAYASVICLALSFDSDKVAFGNKRERVPR